MKQSPQMMRKIIMTFLYSILALLFSGGFFLVFSPQFGDPPNQKKSLFYEKYDNYLDGEFINEERFDMMTGDMSMREFISGDSGRMKPDPILPLKIDFVNFKNLSNDEIQFSWLGHSAFLLKVNGKIIMLDPMLGKYAAPVPMPMLKRYSPEIAISLDNIDSIDMVFFSHDHYDHLDYKTIKKIRDKVKMFYVPLGLGGHLNRWGVDESSITELNWNQSVLNDKIKLVCLPARHFSGRGLSDRNSTLWSSWAIISDIGKIYFSGDTGYGKHFKRIGDEYGPFDLALLDCGQYNDAWKYSHMIPEEGVQASLDLKASQFMPIHWGAFTLSTHDWADPVKRAFKFSEKKRLNMIYPEIGEIVILGNKTEKKWWKKY